MAYLALARKWRPKSFSEMVGQTHVVQALSNALDSGRLHHAYLFSGTRGVGKTTLARIFAKSLNCEQGTSAHPCLQCGTCTAIDDGRYVDLIEVDAASRTRVDDTRELLENVHYAPTTGRFKVFLIDEVHMLSGHSFNALLKTLEEPPAHVKFLFATTDPQKLPITVLSRCLQFNLRAMRPEQVENQLVKILHEEKIDSDKDALRAIARAADGSMRDGLSLLDQAIAQGAGEVRITEVESMLGLIKADHSNALLCALAEQNADKIIQLVSEMADQAVDFNAAIDELLMQLYRVCLAQLAPAALPSQDVNLDAVSAAAAAVNTETVRLYYQVGLQGKRDLALAPSLRVGFEMAMLRMLATASDKIGEPIKTKQSPLPPRVAEQRLESTGQVVSRPPRTPVTKTAVDLASPDSQAVAGVVAQDSTPQTSNRGESSAALTSDLPSPAQVKSDPEFASARTVLLTGNNQWGELVEQTELGGLSRELAMHCACEKLTKDDVVLFLAPKNSNLLSPERLAAIQAQIRLLDDSQVIVTIEVQESEHETPAECLDRLGYERLAMIKRDLQSDPGVVALMTEFGATINEQSIKPA